MSSSEAAGVGGVVLPVYAAVKAASAEGFSVDEVLAIEGIPAKVWASADVAWKQVLVVEKADFERYEVELASAEDWLDRGVTPLGQDLAAWLAFLDAYAAHAEPFVMLERLGLGLNDMSRLKRIWDRQIKEDTSIPKRIAELRKKTLAPLPPLSVKPRALKRRRGATPADVVISVKSGVVDVVEAPERAKSTGDLGLDLYAAICAHHETHPKDLAQLRRYGITSEEQRLAMDARWQKEFTRDPTLHRDFRLLVAHEKRRLDARSKNAALGPIPSPPREVAPVFVSEMPQMPQMPQVHQTPQARPVVAMPGKHLQGTSLTLDVPRGPSLPFANAKQGAVVITSLPEAKPVRSPLKGTAMAFEAPIAAALPFSGLKPGSQSPAAKAVEAGRTESKEGKTDVPNRKPGGVGSGTSFALDVPRGPATPFANAKTGETSPSGMGAPPGAPSHARNVGARLGGTSMALDVPQGPELPFQNPGVPKKKSALADMASFELPKELRTAVVNAPPPKAASSAPPPPPAPPAPQASPILTLEQHASLTLELVLSPQKTGEILARYRLTQQSKEALDEQYRARMASDPGLREAWNRAYTAYHSWLAKGGR